MYQRRRTPSFSSSLLDAICHSIDESKNNSNGCDKILMKKQRNYSVEEEASAANLRRAIMIENWMEKQSSLISTLHSNDSYSNTTTSSSSDSISFCRNYYKQKSTRSKLGRSMKCMQFDKRIVNQENNYHHHHHQQSQNQRQKKKPEDGFTKTKLRKLKQPISPGGRFTSFLNSIFSSGNPKKVNVCSTVKAMEDVSFDRKSKSTCSRSCLSNTPSSSSRANNNHNDTKRSVRFYPVSVIVDEDSRPCGHKCIYEDDPSLMPFTKVQDHIIKKKENGISEFVSRAFSVDHDDDDDDHDALSYSSSDLFELDHLIGIGRYRDELPVYETTNLKKKLGR